MSYSSLWEIDKNFIGEEGVEFENSWIFSPIAGDILFKKYLPRKAISQYGEINFLSAMIIDNTVMKDLNDKINNCKIQEDRIVWELTNQQLFRSKDKDFIADSIIKFTEINKEYMDDCEEHVFNRFKEVSEAIRNINEEETSYFVFKNTNCDNNVEYWFSKYNEEIDEYEEASLLDFEKVVCELIIIEDNKIANFILNTKIKDEYLK